MCGLSRPGVAGPGVVAGRRPRHRRGVAPLVIRIARARCPRTGAPGTVGPRRAPCRPGIGTPIRCRSPAPRTRTPRRAIGPAHAEAVAPTRPGRPGDARRVAIGHRRAVPDGGSDVGRVRVAGAVDDGPVGDVASHVARQIADRHRRRRRVVDLHVGRVIDRRARRDRVDLGRYRRRHRPRPLQGRRREPHRLLQCEPRAARHLDQRRRRIDHVVELRALDRLDLGRSGQLRRVRRLRPVDLRRLRNLRGDQSFLCLRGARERRLHVLLRAVVGNLHERRG